MTDYDIPVAYGTPVYSIPPLQPDSTSAPHHQQQQQQQHQQQPSGSHYSYAASDPAYPSYDGNQNSYYNHASFSATTTTTTSTDPSLTASFIHPGRDLRTATQMNGGSSSRVTLPNAGQERRPLSHDCIQSLREQGFTEGLAKSLARSKLALPLRIWVVDNSGSMSTRDGHRLVPLHNNYNNKSRNKIHAHELKQVPCTRWTELQQTVEYHAQMAAILQAPTVFRLLNDPGRVVGPQQFSIAERNTHGKLMIDEDLAIATSTITNCQPGGVTPLLGHLREIRENVLELEPSLRATGSKVVIVLATDGLPTDERGYTNQHSKQDFGNALRALEGLPVWMVVRLCTDDEEVVEYWNNLDANLELSLEVLDDFIGEAKEVYEQNDWLNYGLPLHRMREMGFHERVFDLVDERKLSREEVYVFCRLLFGEDAMKNVPEPDVDWKEFLNAIKRLNGNEAKQWNPMTKRMEPWIDIKKLKRAYGTGLAKFF